ncbi:MAG: monovalent cation:proton antiporter family protein [Anaerolineae bacterium]|jgi:Kef-type K+ transport system membrane component KefB/Trk K+ transport system NAD-binding subunit
MEAHQSFVPLLIVVILAFFVPFVLSRLRRLALPVVVGEILVGIVVGQSGLGLVGTEDEMLNVLALLGFAYLMFLSGLEVDFDALLPGRETQDGSWRSRITRPLNLALIIFVVTLALSVAAAFGLSRLDAADDPWLMALILSTTSLGLVMPVLKERGLMNSAYGQALLVAAVVADFATMLLVSVYVILHTQGLSFELMLILLLFGIFGTAYRLARLARRRFPGLNFLQNVSEATAQIDVRGAFAIALVFIALAQGLGVEMILGAFLGGALISLLADRGSTDLHHRLDVIGYAFFIPIFFIMVGVRFDLAAVLDSPQTLLLVPVLLAVAYAVKMAAASLFRFKYSWQETLAGGVLLSSHLSLEIAVAAIGLELGVIDEATNSAIILLAIVTSTISPLIFNRFGPTVTATHRKFVIAGAGRLARMLARRIAGHGEDVVIVDCDPERAGAVADLGLQFAAGDARDLETWEPLKPETIEAVAVLLPDDEQSLAVSRLARERLGIDHVTARVHEPTNAKPFAELGVEVVNPSLSPVVEMEYLLLYPSVSSLITDLEDEHDVAEVYLGCPELTGRPIRDLDLPYGVTIVLIRRNGDILYPRGDTRLEYGDLLTLVGHLAGVRELTRRCEQSAW